MHRTLNTKRSLDVKIHWMWPQQLTLFFKKICFSRGLVFHADGKLSCPKNEAFSTLMTIPRHGMDWMHHVSASTATKFAPSSSSVPWVLRKQKSEARTLGGSRVCFLWAWSEGAFGALDITHGRCVCDLMSLDLLRTWTADCRCSRLFGQECIPSLPLRLWHRKSLQIVCLRRGGM